MHQQMIEEARVQVILEVDGEGKSIVEVIENKGANLQRFLQGRDVREIQL